MADFFVRKTGNDASAGTSPATAWRTIGKGLGAAGISSADRLILGGGVYREVVAVAMTSATATTQIIGDVDGALTGDAGEVVWSGYLTGNRATPSSSVLVELAGRDFLAFSNIVFVAGSAAAIGASTTKTSTDITFRDCAFLPYTTGAVTGINIALAANVAGNWTIDRCHFLKAGTTGTINITIDTPATADFDVNVQITNCAFYGMGNNPLISVQQGLTTNTFKYGGVDVLNCTFITSGDCVRLQDTNASTSVPCTAYNNLFLSANAVRAFASGQLLEDYNLFLAASARTNVAIGAHSISDGSYAPLLEIGQAAFQGRQPRPFGSPTADSPLLGFGSQAGGPAVDMLNRPRPSGMRLVASGTATAGAAKTLTDSGATWGVNAWAGYTMLLTGGTGSGQSKSIASNTATVITVDGNWNTNPDNTSTYQVYWGDPSSTGKATAGSTTTLTDSNAAWGVNTWTGYTLHIDAGTGSGQSLTVVSNTATVITFAAATAPDSTTTYSLYKATGITTQDYAVGAHERHDHFERETATTDAGSVGLRISGSGDQDIRIPVTATSTTISVKVRWHVTASNKPQATILANGEIGVTTQTVTATGGVDTWEVLTFTPQSPTASGVVTVRLIARPDASTDVTYFDTLAVA